jgi:uncharacterized protein YggE
MINRITFAIAALALAASLIGCSAVTPSLSPSVAQASSEFSPKAQASADTGISVSGTGKVRAKPDVARTSIGVEVTGASLAEATALSNKQMTAVIEKLKSMGVAEKDIQTTQYNIYPVTQQSNRQGVPPTITGYRVSNQLSVTIRKIDDTGKVLDAAVAAGANQVYGISFSVDNPAPYEQQARAAAVKDAQDKAAQLAKAANITLGKIVVINEGVAAPRPLVRAAGVMYAEAASAVPVETGELEIAVNVEVRFAIQ